MGTRNDGAGIRRWNTSNAERTAHNDEGGEPIQSQLHYKNTFLHVGSTDTVGSLRRIATCPSVYDESGSVRNEAAEYTKMKPQMRKLEASWANLKPQRSPQSLHDKNGKAGRGGVPHPMRDSQASTHAQSYASHTQPGQRSTQASHGFAPMMSDHARDQGGNYFSSFPSQGGGGGQKGPSASPADAVQGGKGARGGPTSRHSRGSARTGGSSQAGASQQGAADPRHFDSRFGSNFGKKPMEYQPATQDAPRRSTNLSRGSPTSFGPAQDKPMTSSEYQHDASRRISNLSRGSSNFVPTQEQKSDQFAKSKRSSRSEKREKGNGKRPSHFRPSAKAPKAVYIDVSTLVPTSPDTGTLGTTV